jgi:FixJ family two-component response regulator
MSTEPSLPKPKAIVFVVDDDLSVREGLERLLRAAGWRVETFASAQEFLDHRKENIPSCLVLDVRLPGLSGLDLQKRIAERQRTKFSERADLLQKPFSLNNKSLNSNIR